MSLFENAKYMIGSSGEPTAINCLMNGQPTSIPIHPDNYEYQHIMKLVELGKLTIAEADE